MAESSGVGESGWRPAEGAGSAPPRPRSLEAAEIGFVPQAFVRWFHPFELARAGVRAVLADMFGEYADRRELQAALQPREERPAFDYTRVDPEDPAAPPRSELWLDFVADMGDGFNATYAIASLIARRELSLAGSDGGPIRTERGAVLIMGGDEVYPAASRVEYEQRTIGPYRAAFPYVSDERDAPHLFAIPGNHDWYDGLTAFLRQFTQRRWIGAWRTRQKRSYFVLELPHRVWLWGIDIQLHADVDGPQLEYFDAAARSLEPGDRVILCTAEPSWVQVAAGKREGYRNLAFIEAKVAARGARVVLVLTGDLHHYARYSDAGSERQYVTAGGGGAFLHGTHALPYEIALTGFDAGGSARVLTRRATFPSPRESLAMVSHLLAFSMKNRAFALLWGGLWLVLGGCLFSASVSSDRVLDVRHTFVGALAGADPTRASRSSLPYGWWSLAGAVLLVAALALASRRRTHIATERHEDAVDRRRLAFDLLLWLMLATAPALVVGLRPLETLLEALPRSPLAFSLIGLVAAGAMVYVSHASRTLRVAVGLAHAGMHVLLWLLIATCTASLLVPLAPALAGSDLLLQLGQLLVVASWLTVSAGLAGLASATVFGIYLWYAGKYLPEQLNDAFSAIGIEDYKNFVRLHVDAEGITAHAIGLRRVPKSWQLNPSTDATASFLVPAGDVALEPELIEPPIRVAGPCPACGAGASSRTSRGAYPNTASCTRVSPVSSG